MTTSSKLEYDFINADLQKNYVHVHLINAVFPDLGIYIVLINAALKRGAIKTGEVKSVQTKSVASNSRWYEVIGAGDDKAMKILRDKVNEVGYPVGNELMNQKRNSQLHFL